MMSVGVEELRQMSVTSTPRPSSPAPPPLPPPPLPPLPASVRAHLLAFCTHSQARMSRTRDRIIWGRGHKPRGISGPTHARSSLLFHMSVSHTCLSLTHVCRSAAQRDRAHACTRDTEQPSARTHDRGRGRERGPQGVESRHTSQLNVFVNGDGRKAHRPYRGARRRNQLHGTRR